MGQRGQPDPGTSGTSPVRHDQIKFSEVRGNRRDRFRYLLCRILRRGRLSFCLLRLCVYTHTPIRQPPLSLSSDSVGLLVFSCRRTEAQKKTRLNMDTQTTCKQSVRLHFWFSFGTDESRSIKDRVSVYLTYIVVGEKFCL